MYRILAIVALVGLSTAQQFNRDPKTAAILTEQRYLSGDGKFGAQYTQEDGVEFKEETDADGTRHGSYSYLDPSGQRKTVSYTAGKNGFQATGDHIPQAPAAALPVAPQPQYTPLPQYNSPQQNYDDGSYNPQYDQPNYQPQQQYKPQQQYQQPQYQPQQYQQPQYQQPQYQPQQQQQYQPQQQQYQPQYQQTTPQPHRFNPPGKLSLNRSPDGFSYSFQKS